jgi:hypothetical protein
MAYVVGFVAGQPLEIVEIHDELWCLEYAGLGNVFEALEKKMAENEAKYPVDKAKGVHTKYDRL